MAKDLIIRSSAEEFITFKVQEKDKGIQVRYENETLWMTQKAMGELFNVEQPAIAKHLINIYNEKELDKDSTYSKMELVQKEGNRQVKRNVEFYNLDAIISIGYRVNSIVGVRFRQWATQVIKERMFAGAMQAAQFAAIDRRLLSHEKDIAELKDKVDFFVQTREPPLQGVFYEGQLWDACSLVEKLIGRAKKTILLIDSWVGTGTLDMLAKKRNGVAVEVVASPRGNKLAQSDVDKFNAQYGGLMVKTSLTFHDRFLIIDDKELYLIGASLKDLGKKCFGFTKMDSGEIAAIRARI